MYKNVKKKIDIENLIIEALKVAKNSLPLIEDRGHKSMHLLP